MSAFRNRCLALLLALAPVATAHAQPERFELGQRLRAFENAWEKQADAMARKRAVEPLLKATTAFFSFRLGEAGRELDRARFALESETPVSSHRQWATSLFVAAAPRILDARRSELRLKLQSFYDVDATVPEKAEWRVRLLSGSRDATLTEMRRTISDLPASMTMSLKDLPAGDHRLRIEIMIGGEGQSIMEQSISLDWDLKARLERLKKLPHEDAHRSIEGQTFGELRKIVQQLADGKTLETNYPAARLLAEAEAVPDAIRKGEQFYAWPKTGQFWLRIAAGANKETVRIFIPDKLAKDRPVPLIIALHGAGGSENMFFDGYGNGKIVGLCKERGWILVAPRLTPFAAPIKTEELIGELAGRWPIDKKRIFLVGHSMGAMQAVQIAQRLPKQIAGVAALGGGQKIDAEPLVDVPVFLGVGSRDFLLRSVHTLHDCLTAAEVKTVVFREYPDLEHLVIVQQALPEVFAFFDGIAKKK